MNRKQRESARARYEGRRQLRNTALAEAAERRGLQEKAIQRALRATRAGASAYGSDALRELIARRAPRLLDVRYRRALDRLASVPPLRPASDWTPRGKGGRSLFRSLAEHLLARFPVPAVLWNAFLTDDNVPALVDLAAHVASGGSLFDYVKTRSTIPLTRKMCHEVLATSSEHDLLAAIRRAQARAAGLDARFCAAWEATRFAQSIGTEEEEAFRFSVLQWFANVPMMEHAQIPLLVDYIDARRREDATFSMKGRTGLAMLRAMSAWHGDLTKQKAISGKLFASSGYASGTFTEHRREPSGQLLREVWNVTEILDAKTLANEGARMGHCVYSYAWRIEKGDTSIWSVQMEDGQGETGRWHMATLEVRNDLRRLVQARGRFNRKVTSQEVRVIRSWANENQLGVSITAW